jgi:pimeloyl-ACP methyl ester carboxylesterase
LLWHGEHDTLAVPAMARYLAQTIPNCRATFYPGEGHSVLDKHTEEILAALTAASDE